MKSNNRSLLQTLSLTLMAMLAFAGNSILGRLALRDTQMDAVSFTSLRLLSGALVLTLLIRLLRQGEGARQRGLMLQGSWLAALALFGYAISFSFAYLQLTAATGALVLFGAVQVTMILSGLWQGERLSTIAMLGFGLALLGLIALLMPGLAAPPLTAAGLMMVSGIAWGIYSLLGRGARDPISATAANFLRTVPLTLVLLTTIFALIALGLFPIVKLSWDITGAFYALLSGGVTSGVGYAVWYAALPGLKATQAASVQLSVPVITAIAGVVLLGETLGLRLILCSVIILGGIALVIADRKPLTPKPAKP